MRPALLYVAIWSLQLCYGSIAAAKSTRTFTCKTPGDTIYIVDITGAPSYLKLSAAIAAGLVNRQMQAPAVFNLLLPTDEAWLQSAQAEEPSMRNCTWKLVTILELWQLADSTGALQGTIVYDPDEPWSLATVVTLCGLHSALPVATGRSQLPAAFQRLEWLKSFFAALLRFARAVFTKHNFSGLQQDPLPFGSPKAQNVLLDTRGMWTDSFEATSWAYKHLFTRCNLTHKTIAIQAPDLMQQGLLADYIVAKQLFAFWLPGLCRPGTPAQHLFWQMTRPAWQQHSVLSVMGYYPPQEEIAACSEHHTEVSLVSDWSPNLSFWSQMAAAMHIAQPPPLPHEPYSPNHTYIALIASDGDSVQMNYNSMRVMMEERHSVCKITDSVCPPVSWTISNRLATLAPFVLLWHYRQAASRQGKDTFLMGPSGFGFTHPSAIAMQDPIRECMVTLTAHAATSLDMIAYIQWDDYNNNALKWASQQVNVTTLSTPPPPLFKGSFPGGASVSSLDRHDQHQQLSYSAGCNTGMVQKELYRSGCVPNQNTLAMEQYIAQFANSSIQAVFSPVMPFVRERIGDIVTFRELVRWTESAVATSSIVAETLTKFPKGKMGYVYKLPDISMYDVEALGKALQDTHVKLVGHREMVSLARQMIQK